MSKIARKFYNLDITIRICHRYQFLIATIRAAIIDENQFVLHRIQPLHCLANPLIEQLNDIGFIKHGCYNGKHPLASYHATARFLAVSVDWTDNCFLANRGDQIPYRTNAVRTNRANGETPSGKKSPYWPLRREIVVKTGS